MIGEAVGQVLVLAVAVSLSPIPIIGVVLMLSTQRARQNGPAFLVGWVAGLSLLGAVLLVVLGGAGAGDGGEPATWTELLRLALGGLLLGVAVKQWRGRPRKGEEAEMPGWMSSIDGFGPARSVRLAVLLSALNPKNLVLVVGAAAAIAQTDGSTGQQATALAIFVAVATIGPAIPVGAYFILGERSRRLLDDVRDWMAANNNVIMAVICLLIAAKLIGDGIAGLSA